MKHNNIFVTVILALASLFTACDDYVDITPTGRETVDSASVYLDLIELPGRCYYPSAFAMLTDNCWVLESNVLGHENTSWDGINATFNTSASRTQLSDNNLYENPYTYILRSNIILSEVDNSKGADSIKQIAKAEAKILRAWDHFVVVNTFAKAYNPETAATDGGVPIVNYYNLELTPKKSSVEDVYSFIIKDIDESLPYLQVTPKTVYHPSRAFGYALKALVHLFHHDWATAEEAARKSLELNSELADYVKLNAAGGPTKDSEYGQGNNPEVLNYAAQGSLTENPAYAYGMISPELVKEFSSDDLRFKLFFLTTGSKYQLDAGSGAALWNASITYKKFFYSTVGLRTAEVYLILAECQARLGDNSGAMTTLNKLRAKRYLDFEASKYTASNTKEMMQQVLSERRKELLFGFHRFWDLKRLSVEPEYAKTIVRTFPVVSTEVEHKTYTLQPDSRLYVIPFPQSAREKNPNLTLNTDEE